MVAASRRAAFDETGEVVPVPVSGAVAPEAAAESAPPAASVPPPVTVKATSPATAAAAQAAPADSSDFVFSESSPDFQIEGEIDPVDALAEEAAVLFANGQDDAARSVLENAVVGHRSAPAERLWLMLFDLYVLGGVQAGAVRYARHRLCAGLREIAPAGATRRRRRAQAGRGGGGGDTVQGRIVCR